jgi:hypothetical protein
MCFDTARVVMRNGSASSPTDASPFNRRSRMARRVGSASAPKVALNRSEEGLALVGFGTIWFSIRTGAQASSLANNHISFLPERRIERSKPNAPFWASTEMSLHVLAYNLTRVMNIVGIRPLLAAIRAQ